MKKIIKKINKRIHKAFGHYQPSSMQLEITNACNFRCVMCPFHGAEKASDRPIGFMSLDQYESIIDQFKALGGTFLIPQGAGESFLHPEIKPMLELAKNKYQLDIGLNTNGSRLTEEHMQLLLDLPVNEIGFSVDAMATNTFQRITGGDLDEVTRSIFKFLDMHQKHKGETPKTSVLLVEQELNRKEIDQYIDFWISRVDEVIIQARRMSSGRKLEHKRMEKRQPCGHLFNTLFVQWDGDVVVCCEDWESVTCMGNVFETPLAEIWNSPEMEKYRTAQKQEQWAPPEICKKCEAWDGGESRIKIHGDRTEQISALKRVWRRK